MPGISPNNFITPTKILSSFHVKGADLNESVIKILVKTMLLVRLKIDRNEYSKNQPEAQVLALLKKINEMN